MNRRLAVCGLLLALGCMPALAAETLEVGRFSAGDVAGWSIKTFHRGVAYRIVGLGGRRVLEAECRDGAEAYYLRRRIDLERTPVLRWSWRVEHAYPGLDETTKAGDDYPARLYVVVDGGLFMWRTRAINYVWSSSQPLGSHWPNAYTRQAVMLAVHSGPAPSADGWQEAVRDVRRDFRDLFGLDPRAIDGVALMTDCDDHHGRGRAWYGDIRFTPR